MANMPSMTFVRNNPGTLDEATGRVSDPWQTTIECKGIFKKTQNMQRYASASLNPSAMPTLWVMPLALNLLAFTPAFVMPGDTVTVGGVTFTVKDVDPLAPKMHVKCADIIVSAGAE